MLASLVLVPFCLAKAQSFDELFKAVERGDSKSVASYLELGLDPNTTDRSGNTILMLASRLGHRELVSLLIARKADVKRRNPTGDDALMMASLRGDLEISRRLILAGAPVAREGWSALHYAAFGGHAELAGYLLKQGAQVNAKAPNGYTALMLAARNNQADAARVLLYEDPDLRVRGPAGETALSIAVARGAGEVEALLRRAGAVD